MMATVRSEAIIMPLVHSLFPVNQLLTLSRENIIKVKVITVPGIADNSTFMGKLWPASTGV